jgi:hypothetical protein
LRFASIHVIFSPFHFLRPEYSNEGPRGPVPRCGIHRQILVNEDCVEPGTDRIGDRNNVRKERFMSKVLLIDYENVQGVDLSRIERMDCRVFVFTGSNQNRIPFELVSSAQRLGERLDWIRVEGSGPNALDFHIAYYLGARVARNPGDEYFVLSRDKGFDPLIRHLVKGKTSCKRIISVSEIDPGRKPKEEPARKSKAEAAGKSRETDDDFMRAVKNLKKIDKGRRPRNKRTLKQHIKSMVGKPVEDEKLEHLIDQLFVSKMISEENGKIVYKM